MKCMSQNRRKDAFGKGRKRLKQGLSAIPPDPTDDVSEESSEEDGTSKHKSPLSCHPTTSLSHSLDKKPSNPPTISKCSPHSKFSTLTDRKLAPSTDKLLSAHVSPTSDTDPFDSDDDSLSSDDSIF